MATGVLWLCASAFAPFARGENADVNKLLKQLKDKKSEARARAASALGDTSDPRAVEPLLAALGDPASDVRLRAASALGKFRARSAVDPLITIVNNTILNNSARDAYGPRSLGLAAISALGEIGEPDAVGPFLQAVRSNFVGIDDVKKAVGNALRKIGPAALPVLVSSLGDKNSQVQEIAINALGAIKDSRAINPLIATLKDANAQVERLAAMALVTIGTPAVEALIAALSDPDIHIRYWAASALGNIKDARAVSPLIAALKDADDNVKGAASVGLGAIGASAVEALAAALNDSNPLVRPWLLASLGRTKDPRAVVPLIAALQDTDPSVRAVAVGWLGGTKDPRAVDPLITSLKDADVNVRVASAQWLSTIEDSRSIEPLIGTLNDPEPRVRQAAVTALGKSAPDTFRTIGAPVIAPLVAAMKKPDCGVRVMAAAALSEIGAPAIEPLIAALKELDSDVRSLAFAALDKINDPRAAESLKSTPEIAARNSALSFLRGEMILLTLFRKTGDKYTSFAIAELRGQLALNSEGILGGVDAFRRLQFTDQKDKWLNISKYLLVKGQAVVTAEDGRTFRIFNLGGNFAGQIEPLESDPASVSCFAR